MSKTDKKFWTNTGYITSSLDEAVYYLATLTQRGIIFQMTARKASEKETWYFFATNANKYVNDTLVEECGFSKGFPISVDNIA
jgi:hypothetical protein